MYKQNYKSDFKFVMRRYKCAAGKEELTPVPWPEDVDWRVLLKTPHSAKAYEASYRGGVLSNCEKTDDGGILIAMDKHGLSTGELRYEFHFELPDPVMASGIADLYKPGSTGIMLTTDATCECGGLVDVAVLADMYKGEPFRYSDFTPEQLEDLRRPAQEAAEKATQTDKAIREAEALREKTETARQTAETQRTDSEKQRIADEDSRISVEADRQKAETARQTAEDARATAETARADAEKLRAQAETLRINAENSRVNAETDRANAEAVRVANETKRNRAEGERKANETARQTAETEREKALSDIIAQTQSALKAANEAIAAADKAAQLANNAAELCATKIAQFEAIGKEILSHKYLTLEN